ncbi:hypothetical protein FB45DRAFT_929492 [Roridomyces roridus]|uniref:Uncharacterized protein n=1 Tax=Roridomyces roridus TaxID=1738132 RepID=A0AAD7BGK2_9AGAR|nr:hypothetical protein FB45DRAFT_929492 [Roridomyces roridus]
MRVCVSLLNSVTSCSDPRSFSTVVVVQIGHSTSVRLDRLETSTPGERFVAQRASGGQMSQELQDEAALDCSYSNRPVAYNEIALDGSWLSTASEAGLRQLAQFCHLVFRLDSLETSTPVLNAISLQPVSESVPLANDEKTWLLSTSRRTHGCLLRRSLTRAKCQVPTTRCSSAHLVIETTGICSELPVPNRMSDAQGLVLQGAFRGTAPGGGLLALLDPSFISSYFVQASVLKRSFSTTQRNRRALTLVKTRAPLGPPECI